MNNFVHLHVHSDNSIQDASVSVYSLADRAEELGMEYLALTDHGNMFGAMEFIAACGETVKLVDDEERHERRKNPIKPILGCEAYVSPASRLEKSGSEGENKYYHLVLLAVNSEGYSNLVKLCSAAYTEGFYYRPRIDDELLRRYHGGLIALSACVSGEIPRLIAAGKTEEAEQRALFYRDLFGADAEGNPNFYLEIQNHGIPAGTLKGTSLSEVEVYDGVIGIARRTGIPLAATNDVHYLNREDFVAHDILLCIGQGKARTVEKRKKYFGNEFYFKTAEEMAALFPNHPEALENTVSIARRCTASFIRVNEKTGKEEYHFPRVDVRNLPAYLPDFEIPRGFENAGAYLRHLTEDGLAKRYPGGGEDITKRADYELDVIIKMGFSGYFLIVADFINWAKDRGIDVGPGRGSGAGSIVAYALRITDLDPIKYGLLFERFLNPERISMPDFDVDFCNERREEVITYVSEKYGKERVARIITFGTLGAKQVIKDVARALEIGVPESDAISSLIPFGPKVTLAKAFAAEQKLRDLESNPRYTELFTLARKLEGLKRHCGIHAAGIVIAKDELTNYVPLYRDAKTGNIATQFSMNYLEAAGLVKMDLLGLKTLDLLHNTEELVRRRGNEYAEFSVKDIDEEDKETFAMLGEGRSFGIFQFESDGMQNALRQAKPGKVEDLIALNALYRPGPMANISQFTDSKHGRRTITYPHPSLEGVLKETYGVIVYQEQVMQVARIIAGYSMGQADLLRRAMGKKKKEIIEQEKIPFLAGAAKQGFSEAEAGKIYDIMAPFAGYGFNKSHAAVYAVLAYRTAYLKAHFPAEFMAANLSNEIHSADKNKLSDCISEARKSGISVDPPDINRSDKFFSVADGAIVFGFLGVKGIGAGPAEEIIRKREAGPYTDFMDFLDRVTLQTNQANQPIVSRKVIELLIKTGAFDKFGVNRSTLLANMEAAIEYAQNKKDEGKYGQVSLFGESDEKVFPDFQFTDMPEMDRIEQLAIEKELIGFYFSGHPLDAFKELWDEYVILDNSRLAEVTPGTYIEIGILKSLKTHVDKTGKQMAFATLEDYRGEIDLAFFGEVWESCRDKLKQDEIIAVKGRVDNRRGKASLQAAFVLVSEELKAGRITDFGRAEKQIARGASVLDPYMEAWTLNMTLDLSAPTEGNHVLVGVLASLRTTMTKNQKEMAFGTLEDYKGKIDLTFFERCWELNKDKLIEGTCIALKGKLDRYKDKVSIQVSSLLDIGKMRRSAEKSTAAQIATAAQAAEFVPTGVPAGARPAGTAAGEKKEAMAEQSRELHIRLRQNAAKDEKNLYPLRDYLIDNPGATPVFIHVPEARATSPEAGETGDANAAAADDAAVGEKIIRVPVKSSAEGEAIAFLGTYPVVAEVWVA